MSCQEGRDHDEKENHSRWKDNEEVRIEAKKGVDRQERERVSRGFPG